MKEKASVKEKESVKEKVRIAWSMTMSCTEWGRGGCRQCRSPARRRRTSRHTRGPQHAHRYARSHSPRDPPLYTPMFNMFKMFNNAFLVGIEEGQRIKNHIRLVPVRSNTSISI